VLGTVREAFLEASFEAIDADYGSLDGYFRDGLGLGPAERKALEGRYLQT
jgi:protein-tyrosine phosphatase